MTDRVKFRKPKILPYFQRFAEHWKWNAKSILNSEEALMDRVSGKVVMLTCTGPGLGGWLPRPSLYVGNVPTPDFWVVTCCGLSTETVRDVLRVYGEGAVLSQDTETELVASHFMAREQQFGEAFRIFIGRRMCPAL